MSTDGIKVGDPATIHYYTDKRAAVVVKVNPKSVVLARVETGPETPDMACDAGAYGIRPLRSEGILTAPIAGTEERYMVRDGKLTKGSMRATLGHSYSWVDWRD